MTADNNKKVQKAWVLYDWANSAYNLVITTTVFPAYYVAVTQNSNPKEPSYINFFGWNVINTTLLDYSLALAYLIIAFLSPILSSIADTKGNKKAFMRFFSVMGALSCCGLFFFTKNTLVLSIGLSTLAAIGYCGSLVFYNAYLPEIAPVEQQDKLSAKGFAYGYIGSVLLQIICFVFIIGFVFADKSFAPRLSFLLVGLWWLGFSSYTFYYLPKKSIQPQNGRTNIVKAAFTKLKNVYNIIKEKTIIKYYLLAFFFYSMGVQTVMLAATLFGAKEIKKLSGGQWVNLEQKDLIPILLIIQLVAIAGAFGMAKLSQKLGNFKTLAITVTIWIGICVVAYFIQTNIQFYFLAIVVGIVMGGIQSLSRSTYSKLIPQDDKDSTAFFSFYDVVEKISIVIGMFSFGFIEQLTHSMRNSILFLIVFFFLGLINLIIAISKEGKKA